MRQWNAILRLSQKTAKSKWAKAGRGGHLGNSRRAVGTATGDPISKTKLKIRQTFMKTSSKTFPLYVSPAQIRKCRALVGRKN